MALRAGKRPRTGTDRGLEFPREEIHHATPCQTWHAFRNEALKTIARDFLEAHDISFVEDAD